MAFGVDVTARNDRGATDGVAQLAEGEDVRRRKYGICERRTIGVSEEGGGPEAFVAERTYVAVQSRVGASSPRPCRPALRAG